MTYLLGDTQYNHHNFLFPANGCVTVKYISLKLTPKAHVLIDKDEKYGYDYNDYKIGYD